MQGASLLERFKIRRCRGWIDASTHALYHYMWGCFHLLSEHSGIHHTAPCNASSVIHYSQQRHKHVQSHAWLRLAFNLQYLCMLVSGRHACRRGCGGGSTLKCRTMYGTAKNNNGCLKLQYFFLSYCKQGLCNLTTTNLAVTSRSSCKERTNAFCLIPHSALLVSLDFSQDEIRQVVFYLRDLRE